MPSVVRPPLPPGKTFELRGRGRTFARIAQGPQGAPTLLLLHGWTATADLNWFRCYTPLRRDFNVVAIDHRGHGRGMRTRRPFRLEDCADDAAALVEHLGIQSVIPVGYSMGGPIAQLMWRRHPEIVRGLVLCATARNFGRGIPERAAFAGMLGLAGVARMTPSAVHRQVAHRIFQRSLRASVLGPWAAEELERNDPATVLQAGWSIGRFSSHDWIGDVDVPTAVVVTTHDGVVAPSRQVKLAQSIPGASMYTVAGDHAVCVAAPERFVPVLVRACREVAARERVGSRG